MALDRDSVAVGDLVTPEGMSVTLSDTFAWAPTDITIRPGNVVRVTRVATYRMVVRDDGEEMSGWVDINRFEMAQRGTGQRAGRRRKPGVKPEGDDYLSPLDPRLEWFWDDVSEYAAKSDYCGVFDNILRDLGLPARKRSFTAVGDLDGLRVTAEIMARSLPEANDILAERIVLAVARTQEEATE